MIISHAKTLLSHAQLVFTSDDKSELFQHVREMFIVKQEICSDKLHVRVRHNFKRKKLYIVKMLNGFTNVSVTSPV